MRFWLGILCLGLSVQWAHAQGNEDPDFLWDLGEKHGNGDAPGEKKEAPEQNVELNKDEVAKLKQDLDRPNSRFEGGCATAFVRSAYTMSLMAQAKLKTAQDQIEKKEKERGQILHARLKPPRVNALLLWQLWQVFSHGSLEENDRKQEAIQNELWKLFEQKQCAEANYQYESKQVQEVADEAAYAASTSYKLLEAKLEELRIKCSSKAACSDRISEVQKLLNEASRKALDGNASSDQLKRASEVALYKADKLLEETGGQGKGLACANYTPDLRKLLANLGVAKNKVEAQAKAYEKDQANLQKEIGRVKGIMRAYLRETIAHCQPVSPKKK